ERKKALFYGLAGAFILRFGSLFIISFLVDIWQVQALGAVYLLSIAVKNLYEHFLENEEAPTSNVNGTGVWMTVVKEEFDDLPVAIDSILAAVAIAVALPVTGLGQIGGIDTGQFTVVFDGGMLGLIIMRFEANIFDQLLNKRP